MSGLRTAEQFVSTLPLKQQDSLLEVNSVLTFGRNKEDDKCIDYLKGATTIRTIYYRVKRARIKVNNYHNIISRKTK